MEILINPSIFHRMQTWSCSIYVVIAVEEKRTHLVYFTWAHYQKMIFGQILLLFVFDDNDNG